MVREKSRPRRWSTVRFRVTSLATLVTLLVLTVAGAGLVIVQRRVLTEALDESIVEEAAAIGAEVEAGDLSPTLTGLGDDDTLAQVVDANGQVLAASRTAGDRPAIADAPTGDDEELSTVDGLAEDEGAYRLVSLPVDGPDGPVTVHVAAPLDDVTDSTALLTTSLLIAVPLATASLAALTWWLVGRTLRPVEGIRREVADIGGTDLNRRVPEPATDDEIARLARTMNEMLDRLETAVARQQRFVADASHELRSPLTRMRSEVEVDLAHPDRSDPRATHRSVLEELIGLQRLVDDLLHLARADAGADPIVRQPIDLDDLVLRDARRLQAESDLEVDVSAVGAARVEGDPRQLARAVANVGDNAARHAASRVALSLAADTDRAVLAVTDDGPGVPAEQRERIFERFARHDESRTRASGGTGLGLAIAREIVERHGGSITVDPAVTTGARFVIQLPLADLD
jgi:signal transduction histidine kinase